MNFALFEAPLRSFWRQCNEVIIYTYSDSMSVVFVNETSGTVVLLTDDVYCLSAVLSYNGYTFIIYILVGVFVTDMDYRFVLHHWLLSCVLFIEYIPMELICHWCLSFTIYRLDSLSFWHSIDYQRIYYADEWHRLIKCNPQNVLCCILLRFGNCQLERPLG